MHRRLAVPMLPLRVWVHCPRASNGLLPPRSNLVGYMRWHARSDSAFIPPSDNPSNSFQFANGEPFRSPINEGLATSLAILAIVHVAFLLSLGYNVGTFLH